MDAIQMFILLFLNLTEPCNAMPAQLTSINGQTFQVLRWQCGEKRFNVWQRECEKGRYWSRPFFLEEEVSQSGIYLNQFAELVTGWHVMLQETYIPRCGS